MKLRFARPGLLVDIGRLDDLSYVTRRWESVAIGALTRHHDVAANPLLAEHCGIVAETAGQVGDPQVRHRGTIGGSVAHGDPASDLPTVLLALDAELVAQGPAGARHRGRRLLHRVSRNRARAAGRPDRDPCAEARWKIDVREVPSPGAGLGYGRSRRSCLEWRREGCAHEHGPDAATRVGCRGGARLWRGRGTAAGKAAEGPTRRPIRTAPPTTAGTSPGPDAPGARGNRITIPPSQGRGAAARPCLSLIRGPLKAGRMRSGPAGRSGTLGRGVRLE